jgi:type II secretory pathway pseudopilin PulG
VKRVEKPGRQVKLNQHLTKLVASATNTDTSPRFMRIEKLLSKKERLGGVNKLLTKAQLEKKQLEEQLAATIANLTQLESEHAALMHDINTLESETRNELDTSSNAVDDGTTCSTSTDSATAAIGSSSDDNEELLCLETREQILSRITLTSEGEIKGATLPDMLKYLFVDPIDHDFIEHFFCTFRSYICVSELMQHLQHRVRIANRIVRVASANLSTAATTKLGEIGEQQQQQQQQQLQLQQQQQQQVQSAQSQSQSHSQTQPPTPSSQQQSNSIYHVMVGAAKLVLSRSCTLLKHWIDFYWYDFATNEQLVIDLMNMIDLLDSDDTAPQVESIRRQLRICIIDEAAKGRGENQFMTSSVTVPALDTHVLQQADPNDIAKALCIIDHRLMRRISRREFLSSAWAKKDKAVRSPNIVAFTKRFNEVSRWVASSLLQIPKIRARIKMIERFIHVASRCRELNNFNAVMAVLGGLQHSAVQRLQKTWEGVNTRSMDKFAELQALVSIENNWSKSRAAIAESKLPCVPYIGLFLKDLIFLEDGMPQMLDAASETINFSKQRKIARSILSFARYQDPPSGYADDMKTEWIGFLSELSFLGEAAMEKFSNEIEPKPQLAAAQAKHK